MNDVRIKNTVLCLLGPTASGKTALAMQLAQYFPIEIVSVDSALVYREMNIGTAKPSVHDLQCVPHHLIDIVDPNHPFSVAEFYKHAQHCIELIFAKNKIPVLVGGSMMYFMVLQKGLTTIAATNDLLRAHLLQEMQEHGLAYLYRELQQVDAQAARHIHPHDKQRIIRGLEVYRSTAQSLTSWQHNSHHVHAYSFVTVGLMPVNRAWLHQRIAQRFAMMLTHGFQEEVIELLQKWHLTASDLSMRTVGYRHMLAYLHDEYTLEDCCDKTLAATRQLAKRQMTWMRNWDTITLLDCDQGDMLRECAIILQKIMEQAR